MKKIILSIIMLWLVGFTAAQNPAPDKVKVEVRVAEWSSDYPDDCNRVGCAGSITEKPEPTFLFYFDNNYNVNYGNSIICHIPNEDADNAMFQTNLNLYLIDYTTNKDKVTLKVKLETFEDDKNERCTYDNGDEFFGSTEYTIDMATYEPEVWYITPAIYAGSCHVKLKIRYLIPKPETPKYSHTTSPNLTQFCTDNVLKLSTDVLIPNTNGLTYTWQSLKPSDIYSSRHPDFSNYFSVNLQQCGRDINNVWIPGNCANILIDINNPGVCGHRRIPRNYMDPYIQYGPCTPEYVVEENWKNINTATPTDKTITITTPLNTIFNNVISKAETVRFRVSATSTNNIVSPISDEVAYTFLPPSPNIVSNNLVKEPSCGNPNNGKIIINNTAINAHADSVRWILKPGLNNTSGCTINVNSNNITGDCGTAGNASVGAVKVPKLATDAPIEINNIAAGNYTLWLINSMQNSGYCYSTTNVTINKYDTLLLQNTTKTNVTCFGANDGTITVKAIGGKPNGYAFEVTAVNNTSFLQTYPSSLTDIITIGNLKADVYKIKLINTCKNAGGLDPVITVTITEPVKVNGNNSITQPTCASPANGSIVVNATAGNVNYSYQLYRSGTLVVPIVTTTATNNTFNNLLPGNYLVKVLDADRLSCPGYETTITINNPPPIVVSNIVIDSVSCFGGNDGKITFTSTGSTGNLTHSLKNNTTNAVVNNDVAVFDNLVAGTYILTTKNKVITGCNDEKIQTVVIPQRPEIIATASNNSVTCFGNGDGVLQSTVTGGSGFLSYQWQKSVAGVWTDYGVNTLQVTGVEPGTYRLKVTDTKSTLSCNTKLSNQTVVIEPNALLISSATATGAACFGDVSTITVTVQGGNSNYTYYYKLNNTGNWIAFTNATTPFTTSGAYTIKVVDSKGCEAEYATPVNLTFATSALSFTEVLSNYNGVNISCFGGNNGSAIITVAGGDAPYQYALDNNAYQSSNVLNNITAGSHTLKVKDNRGCIKQKTIVFTQSTVQINLTSTSITNVQCASDATGAITVSASGGVGTFTYSINNGTPQASNSFTGLVAGTYFIQAFDGNNCNKSLNVIVAALNPLITITNKTITPVLCKGGNNGGVTITAIGGSGTLSYAWEGLSATTNTITNLTAQSYYLKITDALGCFKRDTTIVTEPTQLVVQHTTDPICAGSTNGAIRITATGGVAPYRYSINNGTTFTSSPNFLQLGAGTYNVKIKDNHNCEATQTVTLVPANIQPTTNFLIASRQNERDTLIIKEACFPTPDSVKYTYHPAAIILPKVNGDPSIQFNALGSYWVNMTAYYGGCNYTIRKNLEIKPYDPNAGPNNIVPIRVIENITIAPNPNNGQFTLGITLNRKQRIQIKIQNLITSTIVHQKTYDRTLAINDVINLGANIASGSFVVRIITENDTRDMVMVLQR
jgi:hypothetical protein